METYAEKVETKRWYQEEAAVWAHYARLDLDALHSAESEIGLHAFARKCLLRRSALDAQHVAAIYAAKAAAISLNVVRRVRVREVYLPYNGY